MLKSNVTAMYQLSEVELDQVGGGLPEPSIPEFPVLMALDMYGNSIPIQEWMDNKLRVLGIFI